MEKDGMVIEHNVVVSLVDEIEGCRGTLFQVWEWKCHLRIP